MVALGLARETRQLAFLVTLLATLVAGLARAWAGLWQPRLVRRESQQASASPRPVQPHEKEQAMRQRKRLPESEQERSCERRPVGARVLLRAMTAPPKHWKLRERVLPVRSRTGRAMAPEERL